MSKGRDRTPGALPHPQYLCLPSSFGGRGDEETLTANHLRGARHQEANPGQDWSPWLSRLLEVVVQPPVESPERNGHLWVRLTRGSVCRPR